jgi:2'-5' RNA ligase
MRVFLALDLAAGMREAAWAWGRGLAGAIGGDTASALTWVPAERLHVTMRFLGELERDRVDAIAAALTRDPFIGGGTTATLGFAGIFPPKGRARVVWIGFSEGQDDLRRLHTVVHARLAGLVEPDDELFIPHITIARVKHADRLPGRPGAFGRDLRAACVNRPPPAERGTFQTLTLFESVAGPKGPSYEPIVKIPL